MKEWEIIPLLLRLLMVRLAKSCDWAKVKENSFSFCLAKAGSTRSKTEDEKTKRNDKANDGAARGERSLLWLSRVATEEDKKSNGNWKDSGSLPFTLSLFHSYPAEGPV